MILHPGTSGRRLPTPRLLALAGACLCAGCAHAGGEPAAGQPPDASAGRSAQAQTAPSPHETSAPLHPGELEVIALPDDPTSTPPCAPDGAPGAASGPDPQPVNTFMHYLVMGGPLDAQRILVAHPCADVARRFPPPYRPSEPFGMTWLECRVRLRIEPAPDDIRPLGPGRVEKLYLVREAEAQVCK